jgi:hypothetical protein
MKNSWYLSLEEVEHLITDGNIRGVPMKMKADMSWAYKTYGDYLEYMKGQMTKKTVGKVKVDTSLRSMTKMLHL